MVRDRLESYNYISRQYHDLLALEEVQACLGRSGPQKQRKQSHQRQDSSIDAMQV